MSWAVAGRKWWVGDIVGGGGREMNSLKGLLLRTATQLDRDD